MMSIKEQIDSLTLVLRQMRYEYYRYSDPVVSDQMYDMFERFLRLLEDFNPEYSHENSPTVTVGSDMYDEELEGLRMEFRKKWEGMEDRIHKLDRKERK